MDYKIDGEIRTLDLSKVEIEDELDEDTIEDILDSFKLLFSSGITKGKVNIGENSLISEYLNGLALKSFEFSFKKDEEVLINFDGFDRVTPISAIQQASGFRTIRAAAQEIIMDLDEAEMLYDSLNINSFASTSKGQEKTEL